MNIYVIDVVKQVLQQVFDVNLGKKVQFCYDVEGCGCVVSGVLIIWLVEELMGQCEQLEMNGILLYI